MRNFRSILFVLMLLHTVSIKAQENLIELFIEKLPDSEAYDIKGGDECNPGDIVITIKSDISFLSFDSNTSNIISVTHDSEKGEYVFCHANESFVLTISSKQHISKNIYIDGMKQKYAFKVVSQAAVGKVYFNTTPKNALVDFNFAGQSPHSTSQAIEMNAGEYRVKITKHRYISVDTTVLVPSDGTTRYIDITFKPDFAKIFLDITTADNSTFTDYPRIDIDTAHVNLNDLYNNTNIKSYDDEGNLHFFKLYKGSTVPVPEGTYAVTVNAPGFQPHSEKVIATKGGTTSLSVKLKPITSFLTVSDYENAYDAKVYLDGEYIGNVPIHKHIVRIGQHRVRVEKEGYLSSEKEYTFFSDKDLEYDLQIKMTIYKQFRIESTPPGSALFINGERVGFTPYLISLNKGQHDLTILRNGYLDYKQKIVIDNKCTPEIDTLRIVMEMNTPLQIESERKGLSIKMERDKEVVLDNKLTPGEVQLPKGNYTLLLLDDDWIAFKGKVAHNGNNIVSVPCYSKGTFTLLVGDYFYSNLSLYTEDNDNLYQLLAKANFGRFNLFPGLSTSMLKSSIYQLNEVFKGMSVDTIDGSAEYQKHIFSISPVFLNAEFRTGVSIFRQLDIAALGTYTFYPELIKITPHSHVSGHDIFTGLEITSRISTFNLNFKIGQQIMVNSKYNILKTKSDFSISIEDRSKKFIAIPANNMSRFVVSVGITLGQNVSRGNNMLRILKKPLVTNY